MNDDRDRIDGLIKSELSNALERLPVTGKEEGWRRIERELYSTEAAPGKMRQRKWGLRLAVLVALTVLIGFSQTPRVEAWARQFWAEWSLSLPGPIRNIVTIMAPEGEGGVEEDGSSDAHSVALREALAKVPFNPMVVPDSSEEWELTDARVLGQDSPGPGLVLSYSNTDGEVVTLTEEVMDGSRSQTLFFDEDDAQVMEYVVRGVTIKFVAYKNGMLRASWNGAGLLISLVAKTTPQKALSLIQQLEPYG